MTTTFTLTLLPDIFGICRLPPDTPLPSWALGHTFCAITRTTEELSIVCPETAIPPGIPVERGWRCLRVEGPLPFDMVGVLASLVTPLAAAGISVFAISSYNTDYILIRSQELQKALTRLQDAGHRVQVE